jgi:hypothetical protein
MVVINDALANDIAVFKEHGNAFDESNFVYFIFEPLNEDRVRNVINGVLTARFV